MNYASEQRLVLIDFLLYHYRYIKRSFLMDYYGIGSATATRDFKAYKQLAPNNMTYSSNDRCYYATIDFERYYE
jgi:hypothetical protein